MITATDARELSSAIAIVLTLVAFTPYIYRICNGAIRPHVFSWIIWSITTLVVFFAIRASDGGIGAWPIGVSGSITLLIALLACSKRSDITITRSDWLFLFAALSALPAWFFTADPLWAVIILTTVDLLGYGPTIRKAWHAPYSESVFLFAVFGARNALVLLALEQYSLATVLFPSVLGMACLVAIAVLVYRRRCIPLPEPD